jgi:hypothetical protein
MAHLLSARGLHAFPPEIRQMIFEETMHWNGHAPPLLQALRSEVLLGIPQIYYEALEVLLKQNAYCLSQRNNWSFLENG